MPTFTVIVPLAKADDVTIKIDANDAKRALALAVARCRDGRPPGKIGLREWRDGCRSAYVATP